MKKLTSFVCAAFFAAVSFAETQTVSGVTWTYSISNGEVTLGIAREVEWGIGVDWETAIPRETSGALVIPSKLGGYPVTTIGTRAFYECRSLTSVTIPEGVTTIGSQVFGGCDSLEIVTFPTTLKVAGGDLLRDVNPFRDQPFRINISDLRAFCEIDVGESFDGVFYSRRLIDGSYIDWHLYLNGTEVTNLRIPNGTTRIGGVFSQCGAITSVTIPSSVTTIGDYAFDSCLSLTSVSIPEGVTTIGANSFSCCLSLTSVSIPSSVTTIGDWAFSGCNSLASVSILGSLQSVGESPFDSTPWYNISLLKALSNTGSASGASYKLLNSGVENRAIVSLTISRDTEVGPFALEEGRSYDVIFRVKNTSASPVKIILPRGYTYECASAGDPRVIPAGKTCLITVTRTNGTTFLVSAQPLRTL